MKTNSSAFTWKGWALGGGSPSWQELEIDSWWSWHKERGRRNTLWKATEKRKHNNSEEDIVSDSHDILLQITCVFHWPNRMSSVRPFTVPYLCGVLMRHWHDWGTLVEIWCKSFLRSRENFSAFILHYSINYTMRNLTEAGVDDDVGRNASTRSLRVSRTSHITRGAGS